MPKPTFEAILAEVLDDPELFGPDGACPTRLELARGAPRVLLITGDNASGKSFVCKAFGQYLTNEGGAVEFIGMARRASHDGFQRMATGDEGRQSTGQISVSTTLRGMERLREAAEGPKAGRARVLILDEPDIGLSEAYAAALGRRIAAFCAALPDDVFGVAVVTHNREIARALADLEPAVVRVGSDLRPLRDWLRDGPLPVSDADLESLGDTAHDRFVRIARVLDARKQAMLEERDRRDAKREADIQTATERYRAVVRGVTVYGDREREAAERYLVDLLDACAAGEGRHPGFAFSEGALHYQGKSIPAPGPLILKGTRCGAGLKITLAHGPRGSRSQRALGDDEVRHLYRSISGHLPSSGGKRLAAAPDAARHSG